VLQWLDLLAANAGVLNFYVQDFQTGQQFQNALQIQIAKQGKIIGLQVDQVGQLFKSILFDPGALGQVAQSQGTQHLQLTKIGLGDDLKAVVGHIQGLEHL